MNIELWKQHESTSYVEAVTKLCESHKRIIVLTELLTNEKLYDKKHFPWTGTINVGGCCISATFSHYDWAMKKIKRHLKMVDKTNETI